MIETAILNRLAARLAAVLAPPCRRYRPLRVDGCDVGWLDDERAAVLAGFPDVFTVAAEAVAFAPALAGPEARTAAVAGVARALAAAGALTAWRDERYAVAAAFGAPPLFLLERAAARFFGIHTRAVHANGTTTRAGQVRMWLARRSATKAIDPGQLDNLVGGGVAAGTPIAVALQREAWEEAGIDAGLVQRAVAAGTVRIRRTQPDGLHWDTIHVHDLALPPDFVPANQDGEAVEHRLVAPEEAAVLAGNDEGPDVVTADASLVIADWLLRHGHVPPASAAFRALAALRAAPDPAAVPG